MNIAAKDKAGSKRVISANRDDSPCRTAEPFVNPKASDKFRATLTAFSEEFMLKSKPEGFDAVAELIHERRRA